jgi:Stage II sporulation protein E (SpoIIE)
MGQLRTATRTLASLDLTPAELLGRLDRVTADLTDTETFATCVYAVHDTAAGDWEMASAGHPPPVLASPGRQTRFLDLPVGLPLGVGAGHYQATRFKPPPGSTLVLYTDGLVESPGADIGTGMTSLADSLTMLSDLTVNDACDALLSSLAPKPTDDIAMLMARTSPVAQFPADQRLGAAVHTQALGRAQGRVAVAMAQAPPLTLIFHGKTSAPIRRTEQSG